VTISPPPIKSAHSQKGKTSTATLAPVCDAFSFAKCVLSDFPVSQNGVATADEEESPTHSARPAISPATIQRLRSVMSTVADSQISKNISRNELYPRLVACIEQLSNTMVQHRQHRQQGPHPNKSGILPPLDFLPLRFNSGPTNTPTLIPCLSTCSVGLQTRVPLRTNGVCINPPCRRNFN